MQIPYATNEKVNQHTVTTQYVSAESGARASEKSSRSQKSDGGYMLDISDVVKDNSIYEGHGRTAEDVMQDASLFDVDLQRNYMAVMSNSMSDEDFAKLYEEGFSPADTDIETMVTIMDRIKATLAQSGVVIRGYTDDVDMDTLREIMGSESGARAVADAFQKADVAICKENIEGMMRAKELLSQMGEFSEDTYKYLVMNRMEPTIENFYLASHSSTEAVKRQGRTYYSQEAGGYYSKNSSEIPWDSLGEQIDKTIQNAGLPVNDEHRGYAAWMIENGIGLTIENLQNFVNLREITFPPTEEVLAIAMAAAISRGKPATAADLGRYEPIQEEALSLYQSVTAVDDETIAAVVTSGQKVNLKNLIAAQGVAVITDSSEVYLHAQRCMEEIRLHMTVESNMRLLRSGFAIDTAPLEEVVERLRAAEEAQLQSLFGKGDTAHIHENDAIYRECLSVQRELPIMPAALVGSLLQEETFTLKSAYQHGEIHRQDYQKAGLAYETLMTAPRRDLGDSIQTAFRNTDEILADLGMEATDENRRAVRILGYNRMEVTAEHLQAVSSLDARLKGLVSQLTPSKTLSWIRQGINPLTTDFAVLEESLKADSESVVKEGRDFAGFLTRLEQKSEITPEEKASYIGIYRLLRQIEKSDGAVIGSMMNTGAELQFSNLLRALRTGNRRGMDIRLQEDAGGMEVIKTDNATITEQIFAAYADAQIDSTPVAEDYRRLRTQLQNVGNTATEELMRYEQPITPANMIAAEEIVRNRGTAFRKLLTRDNTEAEESTSTDDANSSEGALNDLFLQITNRFTDRENAQDAYRKMLSGAEAVFRDAIQAQDVTSVDLKAISAAYKQLSLSSAYATYEDYQIPIKIKDDWSVIRVRVRTGDGTDRGVTIQTSTEELGNVLAEVREESTGLTGFLLYDKPAGKKLAEEICDSMIDVSMQAVYSNQIANRPEGLKFRTQENVEHKASEMSDTATKESQSDGATYYKIAKELILTIQRSQTEETP